jgi:predicted RecB family nuclease
VQFLNGKLLFSASDLVNYLGCRHATYLDLRSLADQVEIPERDPATVLIFEKGVEHEKRYLTALKARGLVVVEVKAEGFDLVERTALTRETMRAGADVIYQAALVVPPWLGFADFLERVEEASTLGAWSYEAVDTKLPRMAKPGHLQWPLYPKDRTPQEGFQPDGGRRLSADSGHSRDRDRTARFDPTATLATRVRGVRYLIRQRTFGP